MSSSGFNVIRRHSSDEASIRIKELTQALAKQVSERAGSQLETDDVRSQGRMDHSTIKLNDERLKFITTLPSANTDFFYEFPIEPDFNFLKVWFMLDHLGSKMRDMSGFGNDAIIAGHPTLRRSSLDLGFQQTVAGGGGPAATPAMLFNSGIDVVSQTNGEYIWIPDNESIQFTQFAASGFSIHFRFAALDFGNHVSSEFGTFVRRFATKTDDALNGWNMVLYPTNTEGTTGGIEMNILHDGVTYRRRTQGYVLDTWYQIAVTYNPNATALERIKIYTGGIENSIDGITNLSLSTHPNLRIGARGAETGFFYGYLQDFRLYMGKVLTQTEVTNISANEMTIDNIPKGHLFVIQYAMISQAMRSRTHKYNINGRIKRFTTHKYNLTKKLTATKTHKFSLGTKVVRTRTHKFNIVKIVTRTRTHKYNMGGTLKLTRTHKFNILTKVTRTRTHKFNIGGLRTQYQRFLKSTTAGSNITQDVTYSATPQAIIVWSDGNTQDNTFANHYSLYYGFSDGTHHASVSGLSRDGQTTSTDTFSGNRSDKVISLMNTNTSTMVAEATVSFAANKATFNWTTNDNRAVYIHTLAIWGVNNADVKSFDVGTTSTGLKSYTLNNTSMTPRFLNIITNADTDGWHSTNAQSIAIGAATSSSKQFAVVNVNIDNTSPSDLYTRYSTSSSLLGYDDDTGLQEFAASLSSFGSNNGQFTLNYTDSISTTTRRFSVLAIDSPNIDVGTFTQRSGTGTQVVTTASNVDTVKGVMIISNGRIGAAETTESAAGIIIGGASNTTTDQGVVVSGENDNMNPTETARLNKTGAIIKSIKVDPTVASSTTTTEAALSSVATQDQFTLNWTTAADACARIYHYIVFGS